MSDVVDKRTRSRMMSSIRGKDTQAELRVRRYLHAKGLRFRIHSSDLPGKPDLKLPRFNAVVFVHGCYWHRHPGCRYATTPKSNRRFWQDKFRKNVEHDKLVRRKLEGAGWRVFIIWECQTDAHTLSRLAEEIRAGLNAPT